MRIAIANLDERCPSSRREADWPAAHSMDTYWFAVDSSGEVALFNTGENGPLPEILAGAGDNGRGYFDLQTAVARQQSGNPDVWVEMQDVCKAYGLYYFDHNEYGDPIWPYPRILAPSIPANIDQLPPQVRLGARGCRLPVRFADAAFVQPIEHLNCSYWYEPHAYFASDTRTIRPTPGHEEAFADYVRRFRDEWGADADRYHFEGLEQ